MNTPNKKQIEAINSNGNVIVIAGAGAGKTKTFIDRFEKLNKYTDINNMLILTFSEKASKTLKDKINRDYVPYVGTFHSVFYRLIKNYNTYITYNYIEEDIGNIYEENRYSYYLENSFDNKLLADKEFKLKINNIKKLDKFISENMEIALTSDTYRDYVVALNDIFINKFSYSDSNNIIEEFLFQKKQDKVLSFDDIIIETYFLIKEHTEIRDRLKADFHYIMVDEFQDTNMIVLDIIEMISNDNTFYVGDTLQSIYSFQGADYNHINNMVENCDNLIQLDINYRSSENIVSMANDFINSSLNKSEKIKAVRDNGQRKNNSIKVIENITDYTIPELIKNSKYDLEDICILSRNNNHLEEVENILEKHNIPFNIVDYGEIEHILNTILIMIKNGDKANDAYYDRFNIKEWTNTINKSKKDHIEDYITIIENIWIDNNLANYFQNRNYKKIHSVVNSWIDRIAKSFNFDTELLLENIEARVELYLKNKTYLKKVGVNISTIHKAKGLEWEEVILYNQEDNIFPKDIKSQEEARLFYVAITRPRESLIITSKNDINIYTRRLLDNDYIEHIKYKREAEIELNVDNKVIDIINFNGDNETVFYKLDLEKIIKYTDTKIITRYINNTNRMIQNDKIKNINVFSIEDIEIMLLELKELKEDFEIDFIPLKEMFLKLDLDKKLFFEEDKIDYNYINNDFTNIIHTIINYRSLMSNEELENEVASNNKFIRKFKNIVKKFVSKKYTDLTKDRSKKSLEIQQRKLENKVNQKEIDTPEDMFYFMRQEYFKNSDKQKKYYNENILGMYDTLNSRNMVNFENNFNDRFLETTLIDYDKRGNKYIYTKESLQGKYLNDKFRLQAFKSWNKLKYIEYKSIGKIGVMTTFTSAGINHKWKMTKRALKNKQLRVYGDSSILKLNHKFIMRGDNYIEHIKIVAKELKTITTDFYHTLKKKIQRYEKKQGYKSGHFNLKVFTQDEPHKNLLLHEHKIFYIDEEILFLLEEAFSDTIKKHNMNRKYQDFMKFDKREDTERGRKLIKKEKLEDRLIILENENKDIIKINMLKEEIKTYNENSILKYMTIGKDLKTLHSELQIAKKVKEWKEYKYIKKEILIIEKWLKKDDEPKLINRWKIEDRLKNAITIEEKLEIEEELKIYDENNFREVASVSSYVAKYLMKGAFSNEENEEIDIEEQSFFNGWKNMLGNEIRITNITNFDFTTQKHIDKMFLWYQEFNPEKLKYFMSLNKPLYVSLEELEINGDFRFEYERHIKENFKNSDYIKDIEARYQVLKEERPDDNIKDLWTISTNEILKQDNNYLNIHTDKKLIGIYVKEEFIKANTLNEEELSEVISDIMERNPHRDYFSLEVEVAYKIEETYSNIVEIDGINYKTIYIEDMYIKSTITVEELLEFYYGDIEVAKDKYRNYYNHKDLLLYNEQLAYTEPIPLIL